MDFPDVEYFAVLAEPGHVAAIQAGIPEHRQKGTPHRGANHLTVDPGPVGGIH